ncbi:hypothetical protein ABEF95_003741 [Exophiala dermatitidis]
MASTPTSSPARTVPSSPGPSSTLRPSKIKLSAIDQCGVRLAGDSSGIVMDWKDWPPKDCPPLQLPISGQTKANRFTEEEEELLQQMRESADSQNVPTAVLVNDLARLVPRHSFIAWTSKIKAVNRSKRPLYITRHLKHVKNRGPKLDESDDNPGMSLESMLPAMKKSNESTPVPDSGGLPPSSVPDT